MSPIMNNNRLAIPWITLLVMIFQLFVGRTALFCSMIVIPGLSTKSWAYFSRSLSGKRYEKRYDD
jgi:hypothetical protein